MERARIYAKKTKKLDSITNFHTSHFIIIEILKKKLFLYRST